MSTGLEAHAEQATEKQVRLDRQEEGAIEGRELPNSMMQDVKDSAKIFGNKPLEAQPVRKLGEARPGEQDG